MKLTDTENDTQKRLLVASFAEAWIEIKFPTVESWVEYVASFAEAWIEILIYAAAIWFDSGRLLRGGVD